MKWDHKAKRGELKIKKVLGVGRGLKQNRDFSVAHHESIKKIWKSVEGKLLRNRLTKVTVYGQMT